MRLKLFIIPLLVVSLVTVVFQRIQTLNPHGSVLSNSKDTSTFNKKKYSTEKPGSLWWIVNKNRPLPAAYRPSALAVPRVTLRLDANEEQMQIRADIAPMLEKLFEGANKSGHNLMLASGFRSDEYQRSLYDSYVEADGQESADKYSAKPGTSEHQTGLALDVCLIDSPCELTGDFGKTPAGKWIASHAHEYGFIVRYLKDKKDITGYEYEPWHLRYVGIELATELHQDNQTMEEFFGIR